MMTKSLVLAKYEVDIINKNIKSDAMKLRAISVLNYIKNILLKIMGISKFRLKN